MGSALLKLFIAAALLYQVYSQLECVQCPLICGLDFTCANQPPPNSDKKYCICNSENNCPVLEDIPLIVCFGSSNTSISCEAPKVQILCALLSTNIQVSACCNYQPPSVRK